MIKKLICAALAALSVFAVIGCNAGMAPAGSTEQAKKEYQDMPLEKKIQFIRNSPMPQADKERYVREAQQKAGVPEDLSVLDGTSNPAGVTAPPSGQ